MSDDDHITRVCKVCQVEKPLSDYFVYKTGHMAGKPYSVCKTCRGKRGNEWRKENPEKAREYTKNWLAKDANKARVDEYKREYMSRYRKEKPEIYDAWRSANREYFNAYMSRWGRENRAYLRRYEREYRAKNLELERSRERRRRSKKLPYYAEQARIWRANNKERHALNQRVNQNKRRARLRAVGGVITASEIKFLFAKQRGMCPACRKKLGKDFHLDHIIPIAKGGPNVVANAQLLHPSCNSSKQARDPIEFMQSRGFLL